MKVDLRLYYFSWAFGFEVLPFIIAFPLASHTTLRLWLAVRRASILDSQEGSTSQRKSALVRLFGLVALLSLVALLITALAAVVPKGNVILAILILSLVMLFVFSTRVTYFFLADIFQINTESIHRTLSGDFISRKVEDPDQTWILLKKIGIIILAIFTSLGAIGGHLPVFIAIFSVALSYFVTRKALFAGISVPILLLGYFTFSAVVIGWDALITFYFIEDPEPSPLPGPSPVYGLFYLSVWIQGPILSIIPGMLISMALRFDYQRQLDSSDVPESLVLSTIAPPDPEYGHGIIVPTKVPTGFYKTYFMTALVTWGLLHTLFITFGPQWLALNLVSASSMAGFLLELPIILIILMIVAAIHGESRMLWNYKEDWWLKLGEIRLTET